MKKAIVLLTKDENHSIDEWLNYHRSLKFDHFFIYDNCSVIPIENKGNDVTIIKWNEHKIGTQPACYNHANTLARKRGIDWLLAIDTDEFLILDEDLDVFLSRYNHCSAIGLNWLCFGSSFLETRPDNVLENFLYSSEPNNSINHHIKSFIKCSDLIQFLDPHFAATKFGTVNVDGLPIKDATPAHEPVMRCRINHYFLKSRQEWHEKCLRGRGDKAGARRIDEFNVFDKEMNVIKHEPIKY